MTTIYEQANAECYQICSDMMKKYHEELVEVGVSVDILFATMRVEDIKPGAVTLKLHGYQVAAYCKVNPYKLRVQGHADAEIVIDRDRWAELSHAEKCALMDHELEHLELKTNKDGEIQFDDLGRVRLSIKQHDHAFGWFDSIARRHGEASGEVRQFSEFSDKRIALWSPEPDSEEEC